MSEQPPANPSIPPAVQASLLAVSRLLREAHHLGPEAQQTLAELIAELGQALGSSQASPEVLAHLTDRTAQLVEAVHQQHDEGVLAAARDAWRRPSSVPRRGRRSSRASPAGCSTPSATSGSEKK